MKVILQKVSQASVVVDGKTISSINCGFLGLVGFGAEDKTVDCDYIVNKILNLRLFSSNCNVHQWKQSVLDIKGQILCVSQFTLYAKTNKGTKVDFHNAMKTEDARQMYSYFLETLKKEYLKRQPDVNISQAIQDGKFGAMMQVNLCNDGPVTIVLESPNSKT